MLHGHMSTSALDASRHCVLTSTLAPAPRDPARHLEAVALGLTIEGDLLT